MFAVWPFPGCLFPHMAVASALAARGHSVAIYAGAGARDVVEREGFTYFPFAQSLEDRLESLVLSPDGVPPGWQQPWRLESKLRAFLLETVPQQVSDLDRVLTEWAPDVVVCDPALWGPILVLRDARQVPVALLSPYAACWLPGPDIPPPGLGLPRPSNWYTRLLARAAWCGLDVFRARTHQAVNVLRRGYGLPEMHTSVAASMVRFPLFLVPSCPEFDYQRRDLPSTVHYVGPCLWYPPQEAPPWFGELTRDRPCVHVTEGTIHQQAPFLLRAAAQGLADLPVQVIMATAHRDPNVLELNRLAANLRVERWISYPHLLPRLDVVVTTGGSGTVLAALAAGVPIVAVPVMWDQPENAQRVVEAGVGVKLSQRNCTPGRLRKAVEQVLGNPVFRRNAQRMSSRFRHYGGPVRAAELLEELVPARQSGPL